LAFSDEYGLLAVGTAHGVVLYDNIQSVIVLAKCTLNAQDIANADDNPMSRRKSLKKSLRESFRRLRKGRSQRNKKSTPTTTDPIKRELPRSDSPETRPVERAIEARSGSEDGLGSMVRCLHFAETFIANPNTTSPTLWAGTNSGQVLVFLLTIPAKSGEKRKEDKISCVLGKEIQLKHRAPVISIQVLDSKGFPLTNCKESPHKVIIASEEQFKMFLLPTLKPCGKYKLTAHEGARIRKVGFTSFISKADSGYSENCLTCLTNQGDLAIHSLPEIRRHVIQPQCMKKEDVIGISTFVFTPQGEAFFLASSSELARVSMAAAYCKQSEGQLIIAPNARYEIKDKKNELTKQKEAAEAAVVARQNQLNEQQAQGVKSPVSNGDPHNDTTVSDISADITLDSVRDHTMSQQQLLDTTMSSSTSKTSIKETPKPTAIEEVPETKDEITVANGESEDLNDAIESLESTVITDHQQIPDNPPSLDQKSESETENDDTIIEDTPENITIEHNETTDSVNETVHEKTIENMSENKTNVVSEERVTCVDEPIADESNKPEQATNNIDDAATIQDDEIDEAPLASMESDPAPLASLDSSTTAEMPSM